MDYGLADFAQQMSPEQKQLLLSELLRARTRQGGQDQLASAHQQGHSMDNMAAVAAMANNPGGLAAAQAAQKNSQAAFKPVQMGNQGFMLPGSGEFVPSPIYQDEKQAAREAQSEATAGRLQMSRDALAARQQMEADRLAQRRERDEDQRALRMTLAGMADERAGAARQVTLDRGIDAQITKYVNSLQKVGVPEFSSALSIAEGALKQYPTGKLPGYGRLESAVPSMLAPDEMQRVRADMQQAANILLKARSGAAVTDNEMRRFLEEVGMGVGMDETKLRRGWANVRAKFNSVRRNEAAQLKPELHEVYVNERGGEDFRVQSYELSMKPEDYTRFVEPKKAKRPGDKYLDGN